MENKTDGNERDARQNAISKDDIFDRIKKTIVDVAAIDTSLITPQSRYLEDLTIDSIDLFSLIIDLENHYNHRLENDELAAVKSVQDTIDIIYSKINP